MGSGEQTAIELIKRVSASYRNIKFGRGVVGKTSHATLALLSLWGVVLIRLSDTSIILNSFLMGGGLVATIFYCWWVFRTHKFATTNPGLAMLEGAQFIEYQKWEAAIKGQPSPNSPLIPNPHGMAIEDKSAGE